MLCHYIYFYRLRYSEGEIHFNLMALVTERKLIYERELKLLIEVRNFFITELKS